LIEIENRAARRDFEARLKTRCYSPTGKLLRNRRRINDLRRLILNRHGFTISDDQRHAHVDVEEYAYHLLKGEKPALTAELVAMLCPMCSRNTIATILKRARKYRSMKAGAVGSRICLTAEERHRLEICTIQAFDETPQQAKQRLLKRKRASKAAERRKKGMRTWHERSKAARERPWEAAGKSRRTYYRELKLQRGTVVSPTRNEVPREEATRQCQPSAAELADGSAERQGQARGRVRAQSGTSEGLRHAGVPLNPPQLCPDPRHASPRHDAQGVRKTGNAVVVEASSFGAEVAALSAAPATGASDREMVL
jgi:hypothetical protein